MIERYHIPPPVPGDTSTGYQDPTEHCDHVFEVRRLLCSNGTTQYKKQCPRCGKGLQPIKRSTLPQHVQNQAPAFDQDLQGNIRHAAWEQRRGRTEAEERARWFAWYTEYLNSPVWGRRRTAVLMRNGTCQSCANRQATIAHHLTYKNVGAEPLFDLVAVCSTCHDQLHKSEGVR